MSEQCLPRRWSLKAQPAGKVARIGYLGVNSVDDVRDLLDALKDGLKEHTPLARGAPENRGRGRARCG